MVSNEDKINRETKSSSPTIPHTGAITLAELNSALHCPPKRSSLNDMPSLVPYSPTESHSNVFMGKEAGFEDLSESFRSLYRSLFDSIGHHQNHSSFSSMLEVPPHQVPAVSSSDFTLNTTMGPEIFPQSRTPNPNFTMLMENLKDLADTNQLNRMCMSQLQIQMMRDAINTGDHLQFGMDQESFAKWSNSFNQFLSQLDNNNMMPHSSGGSLPMGGVLGSFNSSTICPPPPPYSQFTSSTTVHMSPVQLEPSFLSNHIPNLRVLHDPPPFSSIATEICEENEEDDDFDWSKLM